jgi:hypothetical protein
LAEARDEDQPNRPCRASGVARKSGGYLAFCTALYQCTVNEKIELLSSIGLCAIATGGLTAGWFHDWEELSKTANQAQKSVLAEPMNLQDAVNVMYALSFLPPLDALRDIPEAYLCQLGRMGGVCGSPIAS